MGHRNHRKQAYLKEQAEKAAERTVEQTLELGVVAGKKCVKGGRELSQDRLDLQEIRALQTRALKLLTSTTGVPWVPRKKPNRRLPAYVEENRMISKSPAEKLPYPKPGKTIHYDRWKEVGGGKGV